jgi:hypothetical protein
VSTADYATSETDAYTRRGSPIYIIFSKLEKNLKGKRVDDVETSEHKAAEELQANPKTESERCWQCRQKKVKQSSVC